MKQLGEQMTNIIKFCRFLCPAITIEIRPGDEDDIPKYLEYVRSIDVESIYLETIAMRMWYARVLRSGRMTEISRETKRGVEYHLHVSIRGVLLNGKRFVCITRNFFNWKLKYVDMQFASYDGYDWEEEMEHQQEMRGELHVRSGNLLHGLALQFPNADIKYKEISSGFNIKSF